MSIADPSPVCSLGSDPGALLLRVRDLSRDGGLGEEEGEED